MQLDEDGIPIGWQYLTMTDDEHEVFFQAVESGHPDTPSEIVEGAYAQLYRERPELLEQPWSTNSAV